MNAAIRYVIHLAVYAVLGFALFATTGLLGGKDSTHVLVTIVGVAVWSATLTTILERVGYTKPDAKERIAWGALFGALSVGGFTGGLSWLAWGRVDLVLVPIGALVGGAMQGARAFSIGAGRRSDDDDDDTEESTVDAKQLIRDGALVIDVRKQHEWDTGHLDMAKLVPADEVANRLAEIEQWVGGDKSKPIVVHCASGGRSARAKAVLEKNGFTQVVNGISYAALK